MFSEKIANQIQTTDPGKGFSIFTTPDKKQSFFYFSDDQGKIRLISRPYTRSRSAERALHNIIDKPESVKVTQQGKKFRVSILNGNDKAVAQSQTYDIKLKAEQLAKMIKAAQGQPELPSASKTTSAKNVTSSASPQNTSFRHSFRLDFYPEENQTTLRGKIEHLLSRETKTFQGLDMHAIEQFIKKFTARPSKPRVKAKKIEIHENVKVQLWKANKPTDNFNFPVGTKIEIDVKLMDKIKNAVETEIYLCSMDDQQMLRQLIGKKALISQRASQRLPVLTREMAPGYYQIIASVSTVTGQQDKPLIYEGKQIIHLY